MRIALLADTHMPRGERRLPPSCLAQLREAELILHAGDISTSAALAELAAIGAPVRAVHGNVDERALRSTLPAQIELELDGVALALTHDGGPSSGRLARLRRRFPRAAAVVFGHSHLPLHEADEHGFQIFNPGSATERRRAPHCTMGIAEIRDGSIGFRHIVL